MPFCTSQIRCITCFGENRVYRLQQQLVWGWLRSTGFDVKRPLYPPCYVPLSWRSMLANGSIGKEDAHEAMNWDSFLQGLAKHSYRICNAIAKCSLPLWLPIKDMMSWLSRAGRSTVASALYTKFIHHALQQPSCIQDQVTILFIRRTCVKKQETRHLNRTWHEDVSHALQTDLIVYRRVVA